MSIRASLAWAWTALILGLCWFPRSMMQRSETGPDPFPIPHLDKLVHFALFLGFAWLWARVGGDRPLRVLLAGVALAAISELGQMAPIVNRDAGLADGLADVAGAVAGLGAYLMIRRARRGRSAPIA